MSDFAHPSSFVTFAAQNADSLVVNATVVHCAGPPPSFIVGSSKQHTGRAGLRGGNGGNYPWPPAGRGPPVMKFICFK